MKLITVALVAAFAIAAAQAQQAPAPSGSSPVEQACSGEMKQLCPGQTGNAAAKCLQNAAKSNPNSVSANCTTALQNAKHRG